LFRVQHCLTETGLTAFPIIDKGYSETYSWLPGGLVES
jgi:hypothetical protein